jgi:hypothetical protein
VKGETSKNKKREMVNKTLHMHRHVLPYDLAFNGSVNQPANRSLGAKSV